MNCNILGYISRGEIVPDVITTLLNRSKTGFMASEGSKQLRSESIECFESKIKRYDKREVEDRIWHRGTFCFEGFQNKQEACILDMSDQTTYRSS